MRVALFYEDNNIGSVDKQWSFMHIKYFETTLFTVSRTQTRSALFFNDNNTDDERFSFVQYAMHIMYMEINRFDFATSQLWQTLKSMLRSKTIPNKLIVEI